MVTPQTGGGAACEATEQAVLFPLSSAVAFFGSPLSLFIFSPSVTESRPGWLCLPVLVSAAVPG